MANDPLPRRSRDRWMAALALALAGVTAASLVALQLARAERGAWIEAQRTQLAELDALHRQRHLLQRVDRNLAALATASDSEGDRWVATIRGDLLALDALRGDAPPEPLQAVYTREVADYVAHWPALALPPDPEVYQRLDRELLARLLVRRSGWLDHAHDG